MYTLTIPRCSGLSYYDERGERESLVSWSPSDVGGRTAKACLTEEYVAK